MKYKPLKKRLDTHWGLFKEFKAILPTLMDIKVTNTPRLRMLEQIWNVKMSEDDNQFYENQKLTPPIGYCSTYTERRWKLSNDRKQVNYILYLSLCQSLYLGARYTYQ